MASQDFSLNPPYLKTHAFVPTVAYCYFVLLNHLNYVHVCLNLDYKFLKGEGCVFRNI